MILVVMAAARAADDLILSSLFRRHAGGPDGQHRGLERGFGRGRTEAGWQGAQLRLASTEGGCGKAVGSDGRSGQQSPDDGEPGTAKA